MNEIKFTATRTENYDLKPYGRFLVKWKTRQGHLPRIIPFNELRFDYEATMPLSEEDDKAVIKFMKKHKTDILTDGYRYYGRCGRGFGEVHHEKLSKYNYDSTFKELVDEP